MPRLLQIDSCLNMCSTGRITESIGSLAISQGWEVFIVHGARYANPPSCMHSIPSVTKFGEYIHFAEGLLFDNHGLASRTATEKIVDEIKEIKPDIIQMHCIHGYYLNYKVLFEYLNSTNIPIVWTFHDCWAFTGHCAHFVSVNCNKWKKEGCHDCELTSDYPKSLVDCSVRNYNLKRLLFKNNQNLHIVTVSKWLESVTRESFFRDKEIQTIYNGIDTSVFHPVNSSSLRERLHLQGKKVLVATATSWTEQKGFNDYIQLSKLLSDEIILILIGLNEKQIRSLPPHIIGLRRTDSAEELAAYYSMADIVLNLSYAETFGLTTVEGMACGTPGIVYNTTASPELITEEVGMIVNTGNVNDVLEAVMTILRNGKEKYSKACRERALALYDKQDRYKEYLELYKGLINI